MTAVIHARDGVDEVLVVSMERRVTQWCVWKWG